MLEGKLKNGFKVSIPEENLDDFEVVEALAAMDEESDQTVKNALFVFKRILGEEQYDALKAHVKKKDGRISTNKMFNEILPEIFALSEDSKN